MTGLGNDRYRSKLGWYWGATLLMIGGLLIAACQPAVPAEPTQPTSTEPAEPTEAPTEEPAEAESVEAATIRIGVLNPTTGALAAPGSDVNTGIELFFESRNYEIAGAPIELIFSDTAADPQQALDQARRLVEQEQVDFLLGITSSSVAVPVAEFVDEQQVPLIVTVAGGTPVITGPDRSPYVFRASITTGQLEPLFGWYVASELGYTSVSTFAWDFSAGHARSDAFAETFTGAGGTLVSQHFPPLGTTDFGPFISQVNPADVDVVYAFFSGPAAIAYVKQAREFGLTPGVQLVGPGFLSEAEVLPEMGEAALGTITASHYVPVLDNAENQEFVELYGGLPGTYIESGYLGGVVASHAIEAVEGDLSDTQAFLDAVADMEINTPSGPFHFDSNGQSVRNVYIIRVVEGDDGSITNEVIDVIEGVTQDWAPPVQ